MSTEAKEEGFTAVILTYNRLESLYNVINRIVDTPSLARIVVVWNNQEVAPPPPSEWPKISKTLKVIKTRANILSNRSVERRIRQKQRPSIKDLSIVILNLFVIYPGFIPMMK